MQSYPYGSKRNWQHQADQIVKGIVATSPKDIPMLLEWLKDMNWPGAETIANHLPSYGKAIGPALVTVLDSGDNIWIHWVLAALSDSFDDRFWQALKPKLYRIAYGNDTEGASSEALYILARYRLDVPSKIQRAVTKAKNLPGAEPDDYSRVEALLQK